MRNGITFGGEAFNRPALWLGDRLQLVWVGGWLRWRRWISIWRIDPSGAFGDVWRWVLYVGPIEIRWWVARASGEGGK